MLGIEKRRGAGPFIIATAVGILAYFSIVGLWPFLYNLFISFWKINISAPNPYERFVGLSYYELVLQNEVFRKSVRNNAVYLLLFNGVGIPLSMILASAIASTRDLVKKILVALYFSPVVTSLAAVSLVWRLLYYPKVGLLSVVMTSVFGTDPQLFLQDSSTALYCIIAMDIWKSTGIMLVVFLAGIEQIPASYFEAADMDGATASRKFFSITVPLLWPQTFFLLVINSIYTIKTIVPVYMMTSVPHGGPMNSTKVLALHLYQKAFQDQSLGYGAVVAIVIFLALLVFVVLQVRYYKSQV